MISNILPVVALAGAAMAACPLDVKITSTAGHMAQVAVTNTASEAITVFKGNTVFLEHATKDLLVSDEKGRALPFEGGFVKYRRNNIAPHMFQTIQPGETVNTSVNAAMTYRLAGVKQADVSALQGFHYVTGTTAPTTLKDTEFCQVTSNSMTITPDQTRVAADHISARAASLFNSRIKKRSISYHQCSSTQESELDTSVHNAIAMSMEAGPAAEAGLFYYTTWFKSDSVAHKVNGIYSSVVGVEQTAPTISCTDTFDFCADGSALLYTVPSQNYIVPCPNNGFWGFPELADTCQEDDLDRAGSILHESTHLYGTNDHAYGQMAAMKLSAADAADNADTYEIYAGSVRLGGCDS